MGQEGWRKGGEVRRTVRWSKIKKGPVTTPCDSAKSKHRYVSHSPGQKNARVWRDRGTLARRECVRCDYCSKAVALPRPPTMCAACSSCIHFVGGEVANSE